MDTVLTVCETIEQFPGLRFVGLKSTPTAGESDYLSAFHYQ